MADLPAAIGKKTCHMQFPYPWLGMQQGSQPHPSARCLCPGTGGMRSWRGLGFACCLDEGWTLATSTVILVGLCVSLLHCWWGNPCNTRSGYLWDCSQRQLRCLCSSGRQVLAVSGPASIGKSCHASIPISSQHGRPFFPSLEGN